MNYQEVAVTQSIEQFTQANGISMDVAPIDYNRNMEPSEHMTRHFSCQLRRGRKRLTIPFSQGSAHTEEPSAADVLDCLASDSASVEEDSFEEWASSLGYDADSRKAEKIYKVCQRQADKLKAFLGPELYDELLYQTERQ